MYLREFLIKSKSIVFIGSTLVGPDEDMKKYMQNNLSNTIFIEWDEIEVIDGDLICNGSPLSDAKFVFVGPVGKNVQLCACLRNYIEKHKIKNLFYGSSPEFNNKALQSTLMHLDNVSQIKTIIGTAGKLKAANIIKQLKLPVVSKIIDGSQGKGVKKHDTQASLDKELKGENLLILQEFVPNTGDFRVFYIRNKMIYAIERKSKDSKKEFRNNVSLGGTYEIVTLVPAAKKVADAACKSMKFDVTGVDIIQNSNTGEWYVIEINSAPQYSGQELDIVLAEMIRQIKA